MISIHTPAKGATMKNRTDQKPSEFQSTHPRRVRRHLGGGSLRFLISIHTPAKGATGRKVWTEEKELISIHTPAKGATVN